MKRISIILGTRPEAIKLAPLILALNGHSQFDCHVCVTAQHREMLDQVLTVFNILPDIDLDLMEPGQSLANLTARAVTGIDTYLKKRQPDMIIVQGDTTTVFAAALAALYNKVQVGHVEAGLRTGDLYSPWPEEANRVLTSHLGHLHFAPTQTARQNLLREGIGDNSIVVTGNTVIDSLHIALKKVAAAPPQIASLPENLQPCLPDYDQQPPKVILITGHRRENFGQPFVHICQAIAELANRFKDVHFIYPLHFNPQVRETVTDILGPLATTAQENAASHLPNVHLIEPLSYLPFVAMMNRSHLILTDSGGIQEEAPSLGKPVLVMRETTERSEAVNAGTVKLVGTNPTVIVDSVTQLLHDENAYHKMAQATNPYGDGHACQRIIQALLRF